MGTRVKVPPPRLLAISSGAVGADPKDLEARSRFFAWVEMVATVPGVGLQIREKQVDDRDLFDLCTAARARFSGALLVNDRPDVALVCALDGVHLPSRGLPAGAVATKYRSRLLVGVSTHSVAEVEAAKDAGADYVVFGPVFATPTKYAAPQGLAALERAAGCGVPVLAIGGIEPHRVDSVLDAGAHGVAAIRAAADRRRLEELAASVNRHRPRTSA